MAEAQPQQQQAATAEGPSATQTIGCFDFLSALRHHYIGRASKVTPSGRLQSAIVLVLDDTLCVCSNRGGLHRCIQLRDIDVVVQYPRGRLLFRVKPRALSREDDDGGLAHRTVSQHSLMLSTIGYDKLVFTIGRLYSGIVGASLRVDVEQRPPPPPHQLSLRPTGNSKGIVPSHVAEALKLARTEASLKIVDMSLQASAAPEGGGLPAADAGGRGPSRRPNVGDEPKAVNMADEALSAEAKALEATVRASGRRPFSVQPEHRDPVQRALAESPLLAEWWHGSGATAAVARAQASSQNRQGSPSSQQAGGNPSAVNPAAVNPGFCATGDELVLIVVTHAHHQPGNPTVHVTLPARMSLVTYLFATSAQLPGSRQPPHATIEVLIPPPAGPFGSDDAAPPPRTVISEVLLRQIMRGYSASVPHTLTVENAEAYGVGTGGTNRILGPDEAAAYWSGGLA